MNFIGQKITDNNKLRFSTQSNSTDADEPALQPPAAPKLRPQQPVLELSQFALPTPASQMLFGGEDYRSRALYTALDVGSDNMNV